MQKGLVSVIIPNYNYERFLRETIDGVLAQSYSQIEIIVVDDGSADSSKEILGSYGGKLTAIFQKNQGVSAARNNGVKASSGEYIAFLDADDWWFPTKIEKQIAMFEVDPSLGLVHVGVDEVNAAGELLLRRLDGSDGDVAVELLMLTRAGVLGGGSGIVVRRDVFDEVGGFDPRLSTSADWDLFFQVANRYKVGFVKEALIKYRIHGSNMHGNVAVMERDMTLAFDKAFTNAKPQIEAVKNKAYGILNRTLAGSYFRSGKYADTVRTTAKCLVNDPTALFRSSGGGRG